MTLSLPWATPRLRGDAVIGAGLAVIGLAESFASHGGHRPLSVAVSLLLGGAFALTGWSLWVPVAATALLLPTLPVGGVSLNDTFVPLFAMVLASYLAASRAHGRERAVMLAALLAAIPVAVVADTRPVPSNLVFGAAMVVAPALAGSAVATRQRLVDVLQERARLLEQQRAADAAAAVAAERLRIARELHDVVAHSLSVMGLQVGGVRRHLRDDQQAERDMLLAVEQTGRIALDDMHRMLRLLRGDDARHDADLTPQPGLSRLDDLVDEARRSGLGVTLSCAGDLADLPAALGLTVYRIVQEALTNVRKHSDAPHADVRIERGAQALRVQVRDDGTSSRGAGAGARLGLLGMQERVAVHGGELTAGPRRDGPGFVVDATLPLATAAAAP